MKRRVMAMAFEYGNDTSRVSSPVGLIDIIAIATRKEGQENLEKGYSYTQKEP